MSLKEQVLADMKEAMKAKDQVRLSTLRMLQSSIKNKEIELRPDTISDQDVLSVVKKLAKQRREAIEQYQAAGRTDLAESESQELKVLEGYLPEQLSKDQIEEVVSNVISETGACSVKEMGTVMKEVQKRTQGQADNKQVSEIIRAQLQSV